SFDPLAVHPDEVSKIPVPQASRDVRERAVLREGKFRPAIGVLGGIDPEREGRTGDLESFRVERDGEEGASTREDDVTGRGVMGTRSTGKEDSLLAGSKRTNRDGAVVQASALPDAEKNRIAFRHDLRPDVCLVLTFASPLP